MTHARSAISLAAAGLLAVSAGPAHAADMPDVMIKVGGGYTSVAIGGDDLKVFASELKPLSECLSEKASAEDAASPDLDALIESGGREARDGERPVVWGGEKFVKVSAFPGRHTLKFGVRRSAITINGEGAGYGHLIVEGGGGLSFDRRQFRGRLEIIVGPRGDLVVVNRIPIEDYLKGMLDSEMSHAWPLEALKAQAVAARSYAVYQRYYGGKCHYHLESSVIDQVYTGLQKEEIATVQAVAETAGEVLSYAGEPAMALFHSCCGGETRDIADVFGKPVPYLKPVKCAFDTGCPLYRWKRTLPVSKVAEALRKADLYPGAIDSISTDERGRVVVSGGGGTKRLRTDQVRGAVGYAAIPGGAFTARTEAGVVAFAGRGSGHGAGMCQYGAKGMAEAGMDYKKILKHYFRGAELVKMY